ncbi:hypothetical protein RI367_007926 [Sorochytrium milnesiophthora]
MATRHDVHKPADDIPGRQQPPAYTVSSVLSSAFCAYELPDDKVARDAILLLIEGKGVDMDQLCALLKPVERSEPRILRHSSASDVPKQTACNLSTDQSASPATWLAKRTENGNLRSQIDWQSLSDGKYSWAWKRNMILYATYMATKPWKRCRDNQGHPVPLTETQFATAQGMTPNQLDRVKSGSIVMWQMHVLEHFGLDDLPSTTACAHNIHYLVRRFVRSPGVVWQAFDYRVGNVRKYVSLADSQDGLEVVVAFEKRLRANSATALDVSQASGGRDTEEAADKLGHRKRVYPEVVVDIPWVTGSEAVSTSAKRGMQTQRTGDRHKRQKARNTELNSDVNSSQVLQHSNSSAKVRITTQVMQPGALLPAMTSASRDAEPPKARSMPFDEQLGIKIDYLAKHQQRQLHYIGHTLPDHALLKGWKHISGLLSTQHNSFTRAQLLPFDGVNTLTSDRPILLIVNAISSGSLWTSSAVLAQECVRRALATLRAYPELDVLLILPNGASQWEQEVGVAKPVRLLLHGKLDGSFCMDGDATLPSFTLAYLTAGVTVAPDLYTLIGNTGDVFVPSPLTASAQRILAIEDAIKLGIHQLRQGESADITMPRHPCPWTYGDSGFNLMTSPAESRTHFTVHPEDLAQAHGRTHKSALQLSTEHTASVRAPHPDDEDMVIGLPRRDGIEMNREVTSIIYID